MQHDLISMLKDKLPGFSPRLEQLVHVLEWVRIEKFTTPSRGMLGRPRIERAWLANAFVAKSALRLQTIADLIELLKDEFGALHVRVRGGVKVMGHLMFGVLESSRPIS